MNLDGSTKEVPTLQKAAARIWIWFSPFSPSPLGSRPPGSAASDSSIFRYVPGPSNTAPVRRAEEEERARAK